ncbi:MAG: heavy metal translocating P-type ATPase [Spirochaetia bacterium]|nr:heavy metal translocating P-type ATPase [Spirochaetia bacterium]
MLSKNTAKTYIKDDTRCFHCGDKIPDKKEIKTKEENSSEERHFCCKGCAQVYLLICSSGNKNYYEHRTEFSLRPDKEKTKTLPYEIWDEEIQTDPDGIKEVNFVIQGIHCASCVWLNENILKRIDGVIEAEVQLATNRARIVWNSNKTNMREIGDNISAIGYTALPVQKTEEQEARAFSNKTLKRMVTAGFFTGNTMLISSALYAGYFDFMEQQMKNFFHMLSWLMATPVLLYSAKPFFQTAYHSIKQKILSMDILTSVGISLAYFYSVYVLFSQKGEIYFDSVCFVTFAILIGRFIEARFKERSLYYVENLGKSLPKTAHLKSKGKTKNIPVEKIKVNDIICVYPGEIVPVDGILVNKNAEIEESLLTGEFKAIHKKNKEKILAGSKCVGSPIEIRVEKKLEDSALTHISKLAEESLNSLPATQKLAEKVSRYFIAFVFIAGIMTFLFWKFIQEGATDIAILHTISLLIAACPCALNLSIPTAFIVASQKAYKNGILMHGGRVLENIAKSSYVVFDKTGTLTEGNMKIVSAKIFNKKLTQNKINEISYALQSAAKVKHPVAKAFLDKKIKTNIKVFGVKNIPGRGLSGNINQNKYYLGSEKLMESINIQTPEVKRDPSYTAVYLACQKNKTKQAEILAVFLLSDFLRDNAADIVKKLSAKRKIVLLTGDQKKTAESLAKKTGIDLVYAEVNPQEKKEIIQSFQKDGSLVTMIGDGINDAIALAKADTGISFANAAEISVYSSDILLMGNNLNQLVSLFKLAEKTRRKVIENLTLSFFYNALLLPMAFSGLLIPLAAAVAMSISSIVVVLNSLRLYRAKN